MNPIKFTIEIGGIKVVGTYITKDGHNFALEGFDQEGRSTGRTSTGVKNINEAFEFALRWMVGLAG